MFFLEAKFIVVAEKKVIRVMFYIKSLVRSMLILAALCSFPISCIASEPSHESVAMRIVELS
ncbi:MAG: hypothetical protein J0M35_08455, partial [Candidatus Obscuribacter phosphatis]|nr:hypothetical protein [Candidatus Obscuribacter phosphatis]